MNQEMKPLETQNNQNQKNSQLPISISESDYIKLKKGEKIIIEER